MGLVDTGLRFKTVGLEQAKANLAAYENAIKKAEANSTQAAKKAAKESEKIAKQAAKEAEKAAKEAEKSVNRVMNQMPTPKRGVDILSFLGIKSGDGLDDISKGLQGFTSQLSSALPSMGGFSSGLTGITGAATGMVGVLAAAAAAVAGVTLALFKLGQRGADIQNTLMAFGNSIAILGDSQGTLEQLRKQTRGTISDVELMRLSIASLQGTSQEFRQVVGPNLGKIFDTTARAAKVTGQNAEIVREKFLLGLRRQSKLLLDDIGVQVDATKAQENYAKSLGKSASALTDLEKQAAFAQEAIAQLDNISKEAGAAGTGQDAMAKAKASFQNAMDVTSVALTPLFDVMAGALSGIANIIQKIFEFLAPFIRAFAEAIQWLSKATRAVISFAYQFSLLRFVVAAIKPVFTIFVAVISLAYDAISAFAKLVGELLTNIFGKSTKNATNQLDTFEKKLVEFIEKSAFYMAKGGALIIGAFAAGILTAAKFVLKAVTVIATIVADFLQGFSPPKMGPLSKIDEGGRNVAMAWAEGFSEGFKEPIENVANQVTMMMGNIATYTRDQVSQAFATLDAQLAPFQNRLELIQARAEQLAGFIDPALEALNRQRERALKALSLGAGDIDTLRALDRQIQAAKELKDLGQDQVDQATIALRIKQGEQAVLRAQLAIRQKQLGTEQAIAEGATGAIDETGAGGAIEAGAGEGAPFVAGEAPTLGTSGFGESVNKMKELIKSGLAEGLEGSGYEEALAGFGEAQGALGQQLDRIKTSKPFGVLVDGLNEVKETFTGIFGSGGTIGTNLDIALGKIFTFVGQAGGLFRNAFGEVGSTLSTLFGEGSFFKTTFQSATGAFKAPLESAKSYLELNFIPNIKNFFETLFGENREVSTVMEDFKKLMNDPTGTFKTVLEGAKTFLDGVMNAMTALVEGAFGASGTINSIISKIKTYWDSYIISPLASTIGSLAGFLEDLVDGLSKISGIDLTDLEEQLAGLKGQAQDLVSGIAGQAATTGGNLVTQGLSQGIATGNEVINSVGSMFKKASGGSVLGNRTYIVGEKGPEMFIPNTTGLIVNNDQFASAIQALSSQNLFGKAEPLRGGGQTTISNSNSSTFNQTNNIQVPNRESALLMTRQFAALAK